MPSILFIHENFPAQFGGLARYLAAKGWYVVFATAREDFPTKSPQTYQNYTVVQYRNQGKQTSGHPYLAGTERAIRNGQGFSRLAAGLEKGGFKPDLVVAHSGWGSGSFAKIVWPDSKLVQYLEWWYQFPSTDQIPGGEVGVPEDNHARALVRNLPFLLDFQQASIVVSPTSFQADQAPAFVQAQTVVQHDGVDCKMFRPLKPTEAPLPIEGVPDDAQIVTFATRGMEPMRGFPDFMDAAAELMARRPALHVVIAGEDRAAYGPRLAGQKSFKEAALSKHKFDMKRLHFVGLLPKPDYARLLRRSDAHAYLTVPFVLSWSMIEAMASACPLVVTEVAPVLEALGSEVPALTVAPNKVAEIVNAVLVLLDNPDQAKDLGAAARIRALQEYDTAVCHSNLERLLTALISDEMPAASHVA